MSEKIVLLIQLLRLVEVEKMCGVKKSFIYREMNEGRFPRAVKLSTKSVAWRSDEIQNWVDERPRVMS